MKILKFLKPLKRDFSYIYSENIFVFKKSFNSGD